MINLLPKQNLKELRASKRNVLLRRYIVLLTLAIVLLTGIFVFMYATLEDSKKITAQVIVENDKRVASYKDTKLQGETLNNNLIQVKNILSQRVDYSKVLVRIAQILPANVSIQSIQLESKLFEGTKTIQINAPNLDSVVAAKAAFENSGLFSSVKIDSTNEVKDSIQATFSLGFNRKGFEL